MANQRLEIDAPGVAQLGLGVEALGKPQKFEFSRKKSFVFEGQILNETFSTGSLGCGQH